MNPITTGDNKDPYEKDEQSMNKVNRRRLLRSIGVTTGVASIFSGRVFAGTIVCDPVYSKSNPCNFLHCQSNERTDTVEVKFEFDNNSTTSKAIYGIGDCSDTNNWNEVWVDGNDTFTDQISAGEKWFAGVDSSCMDAIDVSECYETNLD